MASSTTSLKALTAALALLSISGLSRAQYLPRQRVLARDDEYLAQPIYTTVPLGTIKPQGWLKGELQLEAEGLAGNMFDFYRYVHDSMWLGGDSEYSTLHESAPYWFNGLVPLAFSLGDSRLEAQVKTFLDYILEHQAEDGWLGPETTPQTRGLWGRCYILLGLVQYADADSAQTDRIVDAMHRYVELSHSMLKNNFTGLIQKDGDVFDFDGFGLARAHEMHIPLTWLYENYPKNNSQIILETMELMIEGNKQANVDWREFWVEGTYPEVVYAPRDQSYSWLFTHAVNMAEGLRFPLSIYRTTNDTALKTQTRTAVDLLAKWHKSLSGSIIGDEFITDLNPSRGAELCTTAEVMFSLAYIYQYLGDNDLADWVELAAFNALPGQMAPDWWSHQYVQQENQPWSRNLTVKPEMWQNVDSQGNVFGLEPNYPCCTVNHPQAYPKFLANSYVVTEDYGIAHVLLAPSSLNSSNNGTDYTIVADTSYPFSFDLNYIITSTSDFTFYVRIPSWANSSSTYTGPSGESSAQISPSDRGFQRFDIPKGDSAISISFQTEPRVEHRANNTAAIYYGALLYSLAIDSNVSAVAPLAYDGSAPLGAPTANEHTRDHHIEPTGPWNVAIDPSQIRVVVVQQQQQQQRNNSDASELPSPIWDYGAPPVELRVAAVQIDWPLAFDSPADPPREPRVTGKPFSARFVPFGSAKVHMAHLPVVQLEEVDLV
ncbi:duf1680 domain-containing protein [Biscogniauxia marginata]|nr:duf1680 domain-containing protein [Biscogniauxia marginata]